MKIYHNARCSKSREGLAILKDSNQTYEIVDYLNNTPSEKELKNLLKMLEFSPIELVRKNEKIWKEHYKGKALSNDAIIKAMITHPKLIERPIVVHNNRAVLGRPPENIKALLE